VFYLNNLGILQKGKYECDKAEKYYMEALKIRLQLAKTKPTAFEIPLADTYLSLSNLYQYDKPKPSQSLQYAKAAAALYTKYAATVPRAKNYLEVAEETIQYWAG